MQCYGYLGLRNENVKSLFEIAAIKCGREFEQKQIQITNLFTAAITYDHKEFDTAKGEVDDMTPLIDL